MVPNTLICIESGYIKDMYTSDGLHLDDSAYEEWSELMRPYLQNN